MTLVKITEARSLTVDQCAELLNCQREWIKEELFERLEEWQVDAMTDEELRRTIDESFDGGIDAFINRYIDEK